MYLLNKGEAVPPAYRKVFDGANLSPEYSEMEFYIEESKYVNLGTVIGTLPGRDVATKRKSYFMDIIATGKYSTEVPKSRNSVLMEEEEDETDNTHHFVEEAASVSDEDTHGDGDYVFEEDEEELPRKMFEEDQAEMDESLDEKYKQFSESHPETVRVVEKIHSVEMKEVKPHIAESIYKGFEESQPKVDKEFAPRRRLEDLEPDSNTAEVIQGNGVEDTDFKTGELTLPKNPYKPVMLKEMEKISEEDQEIIIDYLYLVEPKYAKEAILDSLEYTDINEHFIMDLILKTGHMNSDKEFKTGKIRDIFINLLREVEPELLKESFLHVIESEYNYDREYLEYVAVIFDRISSRLRREVKGK